MATIAYLTTVEFGAGALSTLPDQLTAVGMTRPLIVSDRGLATTGLVKRIESLCPPGSPVFLDARQPDRNGIATYSPVAAGAVHPWLRGPRTTVIRSMRFKPAYFDCRAVTALPTCVSHSACVLQHGGVQLNTVSTT